MPKSAHVAMKKSIKSESVNSAIPPRAWLPPCIRAVDFVKGKGGV